MPPHGPPPRRLSPLYPGQCCNTSPATWRAIRKPERCQLGGDSLRPRIGHATLTISRDTPESDARNRAKLARNIVGSTTCHAAGNVLV